MLLLLGRAAQPDASDETTRDYNRRWAEWAGGLAQRGALRSGGPFEATGRTISADSVSELQLQPVDIGGFLLIDAADMQEATEIARQAPHIALGGTTVVRPCVALAEPAPPSS